MTSTKDLAALYQRDLTRLLQQVQAFPEEESLWIRRGKMNSAGNLALHLEGNLREYIGRQVGGRDYQRDRPQEFSATGIPQAELIRRLEETRSIVVEAIAAMPAGALEKDFPERMFDRTLSTGMLLVHLLGHLNYHLGQMDTIRRFLTEGGEAVDYAGLP